MIGVIDTNILIYATAELTPEYAKARLFLETALAGPQIYTTTWINIAEYLSFMTQPLGTAGPVLTLKEATTNVESLLQSPFFKIINEGDEHWNHLTKILEMVGAARGSFIHDCRIAAIMQENGLNTIFTRDADFRKIPQLKVINPI